MMNLIRNPLAFVILGVLSLVFAWQINKFFGVSGDGDDLNRLYACVPCLILIGLKAKTMTEKA